MTTGSATSGTYKLYPRTGVTPCFRGPVKSDLRLIFERLELQQGWTRRPAICSQLSVTVHDNIVISGVIVAVISHLKKKK